MFSTPKVLEYQGNPKSAKVLKYQVKWQKVPKYLSTEKSGKKYKSTRVASKVGSRHLQQPQ